VLLDAPIEPFANRLQELNKLTETLTAAVPTRQLRVWSAEPAHGVTSWLRYFQKYRRHDGIVLYLDASDGVANSLFSSIYVGLRHYYPEQWKIVARELGSPTQTSHVRQMASALASAIPYVGRAVETGIKVSDIPVNPTYYASLAAESFSHSLRTIAQKAHVLLLVDNAQDIDDASFDLFAGTAGSTAAIHYELAYVHRDSGATARFDPFVARLEQLGYTVCTETLQPLTASAVEEWATLMQPLSEESVAARVAAESGGNVYQIAQWLRHGSAAAPAATRSPLETAILLYLTTARQSMRLSDIVGLLMRPNSPVLASEGAIEADILRLQEANELSGFTLPDGDLIVRPLQTTPLPHREDVSELACATALYEFFISAQQTSTRHSAAEVVPLLYRLSKVVAPDETAQHAQELLRLSLAMGSSRAANGLIENATLPLVDRSLSFVDYIVRVCALFASRRYSAATALLSVPPRPEWGEERLVRVLLAIGLNRCRDHAASEQHIRSLLETSSSLEEQVLLLSYSLVGKLHEGDVRGARQAFIAHRESLRSADNYGYFLRNAASAMEPEESLEVLSEAIVSFERTHDTFGAASTLSNRGNNFGLLGRFADALEDQREAYNQMQMYGAVHLHIVLNNLGIATLLTGDAANARELLRRSRAIAENEMPRTFAGINLCFALAVCGDDGEAAALLHTLEAEATNAVLDRVRQRFFPNAAILSKLLGFTPARQEAFYEAALRFPDRARPIAILERLHAGRRVILSADNALEYMTPAYLAYWYQNPLEMLPLQLLARQARAENQFNE